LKKQEDFLSEISRKLDLLIRLSALDVIKDLKAQKDQIMLLSDVGFQPKEIAGILGTSSNTVRVALHSIRKKETKEKKETTEKSPQDENEFS